MATDLSLLKSAVTDVLDLSGTAAEDKAQATAQAATASGDAIEAGAYGSAVAGANQSAALADVAGNIKDIQEQRKIGQTLGSQRAAVAANGFQGNSGSSLAILKASLQQGYLTTQLNDVQTNIDKSGYLEQAAASTSEQAAADAAAKAATTLSGSYSTAGSIATANAASETNAISAMLKQDYAVNGPLTAQQQATQDVVTSAISSPLNGAISLPASAVPATNFAGASGSTSGSTSLVPGATAGTLVPSAAPAGSPTAGVPGGLPSNMSFMSVGLTPGSFNSFVPTTPGRTV